MNDLRSIAFKHRSLKEAVDNLPSGICYFNDMGLVALCNKTMYHLSFALSGRDVQTLDEFKQSFKENEYYELEDKIWNFSYSEVKDELGNPYTQVIASDVSDLYHQKQALEDHITALNDSSIHIQNLRKNLVSVTRENEILSMKMQMHDELGRNLLSLRHYYLNRNIESKDTLIKELKSTISKLHYNKEEEVSDPMKDLLNSASAIGVEIVKTGELPEDKTAARLIVKAVRECLTNAVRHANAAKVFVHIETLDNRVEVTISNDGNKPVKTIVEGGGLGNLRARIEKSGGTMIIQSIPEFKLVISLPLVKELEV